ncbi:MAG: glycoside hydrolase, partial [Aliifodinibius sp.]|nr:glycoside hydrolase [Fodinibius sp.]NIV12124.1 glycoside hydrolase [Fodinibius sp.]NIY25758.1 glycoside hydrolase [Fodinibius sp.]
GNGEFIHSAGRVKVSSIDPEAENYDEYNLNRYLESRRYLQHKKGNIINVEDMYEI